MDAFAVFFFSLSLGNAWRTTGKDMRIIHVWDSSREEEAEDGTVHFNPPLRKKGRERERRASVQYWKN